MSSTPNPAQDAPQMMTCPHCGFQTIDNYTMEQHGAVNHKIPSSQDLKLLHDIKVHLKRFTREEPYITNTAHRILWLVREHDRYEEPLETKIAKEFQDEAPGNNERKP